MKKPLTLFSRDARVASRTTRARSAARSAGMRASRVLEAAHAIVGVTRVHDQHAQARAAVARERVERSGRP